LILGDGTTFPQRGRALLVNREVDTRTGTILVRAEFPNPGNVLRPGQYARIRAITEVRKGALVVPQQAVLELQGIYQVGVVGTDNKVTIKTVKLGPQLADVWLVESGLQAGDSVVVDGLQRIKSGMTVAPTPFKDTQASAPIGGN
jgi:membrane fusion protein, multidrug efflux system